VDVDLHHHRDDYQGNEARGRANLKGSSAPVRIRQAVRGPADRAQFRALAELLAGRDQISAAGQSWDQEDTMQLYDFAYSPNSSKVRAVAYELGIPLEVVDIDLLKGKQRAPEFLALNPNGRVPVLVDGDLVLWESTAIMRYLARGSALVPTGPRLAAEVDRWIAWQLAHLGPAMGKVAYEKIVKAALGKGPLDEARIAEGTTEFHAMSAILDDALAGKEYVAGPLTIADFALAAHYNLAAACGLDATRHPRVAAWLARVSERDSMRRVIQEGRARLAA
jgi:glutathione S-transferase